MWLVVTVCLIVLLFPDDASAHAPHDEVSAIVLSPDYLRDGIVFAIVRYNILRSLDFGYTWRRLTRGLGRCEFRELAISPSFAIDHCLFAASPLVGLFRSTDAGLTWQSLNGALPDRRIAALAISPAFDVDRRLLAISDAGALYWSDDAGDHWRQSIPAPRERVSAAAITGETLVAGTSAGELFISDDNGRGWRVLARQRGGESITCMTVVDRSADRLLLVAGSRSGCVVLAITAKSCDMRPAGLDGQHVTSLLSPRDPGDTPLLFATAWREAVFRSDDLGRSWQKHATGLTTDRQADWPEFRRPHFKGLTASATFAIDQTVFLGGFDGVFRSTDGGRSWRELRGSLPTGLIVGLDVGSANDGDLRVGITTYLAGAYAMTATGPWDVLSAGMEAGRLSALAFSPHYASDHTMFALGNWALFRSIDNGKRWMATPIVSAPRTLGQLQTCVHSALRQIVPPLTRWIGRERVARWKQWFALTSTLAGGRVMGPGWGGTLDISPDFTTDRTLFVSGPSGVFRSQDGGMSFDAAFGPAGTPVRSVAVSPHFRRDGTVFVACDGCLYRSVDRGTTWERWFEGDELASPRLALSPAYADDRTLFAACEPGLWRSRDGGRQWQRLATGDVAPDAAVDGLAVSPNFRADRELIVHVFGAGLFHSRDEGDTFYPVKMDGLGPYPTASHMVGFPDRTSLIRFSPHYGTDRTLFVSSMEDLLASSNGGATWRVVDRPVRVEDVRPEIAYRGAWEVVHHEMFSSRSATCSSHAGDTATMEFVGREVRWIGQHGPRHGVARVLIDGVLSATVDQYAPTVCFETQTFGLATLSRGPHAITVEVTGTGNPRSAGHNIVIDAFEVSSA